LRFYITYIFSGRLGGFCVLIQKPLQAIDELSGFGAGGLPCLFRPKRQWYFVDQLVDAIHPLEDLAKRHAVSLADDRSLALAYVNSGARKIACRTAFRRA